MSPESLPVASAPVSFGVDEIIVDDAWMPGPDDMLDWMVEIGYRGTELGPPGFLGTADEVQRRLSSRGLQLVGAFLPQHFSRNEAVDADRAWLRDSLRLIRDAAPEGSRTFAILCDQFDEPERLAFSGRIAEHPEAWLPADRFETLSWTSELPVSLPRLKQAIGRLAPRLARAKGLFETVEQPGRQFVFQLAGGRATLAPSGTNVTGAPRTRIVFVAEVGRLSKDEIGVVMNECIDRSS